MQSLVLLLPLTLGLMPVEVQTLDGKSLRGDLAEIDERHLALDADGKRVTVPVADVQQVRVLGDDAKQAPAGVARVELIDGSELSCAAYVARAGTAQVKLAGGEKLAVATRLVRCVRFKSQSASQAEEWNKIRAEDAAADRIVLRKKDRLDFVQGVIAEVADDAVKFDLDGEPVRVPHGKVEGLIYYHAQAGALPSATAIVVGRNGSRIEARRIEVDGNELAIATPAGLELRLPLSSVKQMDFAVDRIVYLSDLDPTTMKWQPYFALGKLQGSLTRLFAPRKDRTLLRSETSGDDGALLLRHLGESGMVVVRPYAKGLALHSRTVMVYSLPDKFRRFKATAGIDARLGNQGNVRLILSGDGQELFAANIAGGEQPRQLDVDIKGVRKLTVTVDYGENLDSGDYLNLCEARLVK